jgi:hypothetical protein
LVDATGSPKWCVVVVLFLQLEVFCFRKPAMSDVKKQPSNGWTADDIEKSDDSGDNDNNDATEVEVRGDDAGANGDDEDEQPKKKGCCSRCCRGCCRGCGLVVWAFVLLILYILGLVFTVVCAVLHIVFRIVFMVLHIFSQCRRADANLYQTYDKSDTESEEEETDEDELAYDEEMATREEKLAHRKAERVKAKEAEKKAAAKEAKLLEPKQQRFCRCSCVTKSIAMCTGVFFAALSLIFFALALLSLLGVAGLVSAMFPSCSEGVVKAVHDFQEKNDIMEAIAPPTPKPPPLSPEPMSYA